MRVVQIAIGKFHHFHLARYLDRHGDLAAIYCGYPWSKLKGESIPRSRVRTFPWLQAPYMALGRIPGFHVGPRVKREWEWLSQMMFARYAARTLPDCDAIVGLSGAGLEAGSRLRQKGGVWVCDRGSTHIRFQEQLLREEHERWGVSWIGIDPRMIEREQAEYEQCDWITVPSQFNVDSFEAMGVPIDKIRKISYGANISRFKPVCERDPNRFIVLFVGSISLRKGILYLLQAFQKFKHPNKELWIVGLRSNGMDALLNRFGHEQVKYLGMVPNTELAKLYSQAHAFVLPSIEEGLAVVQGEALACGCPVIATTHTGASDLFDDGQQGFIVPIRDADSIVEKLTMLADDTQLAQQLSESAIARVSAIGGWDQYGTSYREFLSNVLESKR